HEIEVSWAINQDFNEKSKTFQVRKVKEGEQKKKFRILSLTQLLHLLFKIFLKASEREVLITGDHSLSEAFSAGKFCMNEFLIHKKRLVQSLIQVATTFNPQIQNVAKAFFSALNNEIKTLDFITLESFFPDEAMEELFQAVREARKNSLVWDQYIRHLYTEHNAYKKVDALVEEMLEKGT
ncbi:MAG: hypothetical protein JWO53_1047, partial [Chlamydiia bacterium]|nr:hypothetical protein [Chlamydiia bacterium]